MKRVMVGNTSGWIVGNGGRTLWRIWEFGMPKWTEDKDRDTRFHHREDAEAVHG